MIFGDYLRTAREAKGITLQEAADRLSIHKSTLHRYESSEIHRLPADKLEQLIAFYGTSASALLNLPIGWSQIHQQGFYTRILQYSSYTNPHKELPLWSKYEALDARAKGLIRSLIEEEYARSLDPP